MSQPETANVVQIAFADYEPELANTRKVLAGVTTENLGFKPHEKSWSLGTLAQHVANLPWWFEIAATQNDYDMATWVRPPDPTSAEEIREQFEEKAAAALGALKTLKAASLMEPWTLRAGETVYFSIPRIASLRTFAISHMIHHRAQLTIYFRLLNLPIPGLYGPSADEQ